MIMRSLAAAAVLSLALTSGAFAQPAEGRFQIEPVEGGVLRLDRATGGVEFCAEGTSAWTCEIVVAASTARADGADGSLAAENAALKARVTALEKRLAMIGALVEGAEVEGEAAAEARASSDLLQSRARRGIDEAVEVTGYAVRRFRDLYNVLTDDEVE
ncbi:hypothetical protein [Acuticoccus kandeliae]|uniref:hypothetical protein n=1 Tax=Acuticoccus kandeliae TaxID=2073160 RepID=UPI001300472A|nr:hypothetical protein [Acuticoccus kandeliae]